MTLEISPEQGQSHRQHPNVGGTLRRWWQNAEDYQKFAYPIAAGLFVVGLIHGLIWFFTGDSVIANVSWRKPTLFLTACGVTAGTFIWALNYLTIDRQTGWQLTIGVIAPATLVSSMVAFQQWRGTRSHFNFFESPFDAVIAAFMVVMIQLLLPTAIIYSRLTFTALRPVSADLALALRAGILLVNVSFFIGFVTIMNAVTNGLLFTIHNASVIGQAGSMKVPHGVALHGLQVFLGAVALMQFTAWDIQTRVRIVWLAVAGYSALAAVAVYQTLSGQAALNLNFLIVGVVGLGLALVGVALALALGGAVRSLLSADRTNRATG